MSAEPLLVGESAPAESADAQTVAHGARLARPIWPQADSRGRESTAAARSGRLTALIVAGLAACLTLVIVEARSSAHQEPLRLAVAALIGVLVTAIYRRRSQDPYGRAMQHAQILLCVSGAMTMVLISDSLPRAFALAGAASIIKFRTPVDDPRDAVVLFLLMALGMASGLGAFTLAASATAMLCLFLLLLDRFASEEPRVLLVELVAAGSLFPADHVQRVFARHGAALELRELSYGETATARYLVTCATGTSLESLNADLMAGQTAGLRAVAWEPARKKQL